MISRAQRYIERAVREDLEGRMVFVAGPRQVGKTTFSLSLQEQDSGYLNWDIAEDREAILNGVFPASDLWILDQIHKYSRWRDLLKGLWDARVRREAVGRRILVTGSARLDMFRTSGDSLQGRYFLHRLHPFSVAELGLETTSELEDLMTLGGFPEPWFGGSESKAKRWSRSYRELLIREELGALEDVRDLGQLELLMLRLPALVGSTLSINALHEDLQIAHKTVESWVQIFERLYAIHRLGPLTGPRIRALKKAQKHYHFDWTLVKEEGPRFENLVANHLLKWVHHQIDTSGRDLDLRYFRDKDGREVDFIVTENDEPVQLIECKLSDRPADKNLKYLSTKYPDAEALQVAARGQRDASTAEGIRFRPAVQWLRDLV